MSRQWKPYLGDRLIFEHEDDFYVIKDKNYAVNSPVFCPLCDYIMTTTYDMESYRKFECCDACSNKFVYPHLEDWKNGWRPTKEFVSAKLKI